MTLIPETIQTTPSTPPAWLLPAGRWLWNRDLAFRVSAARTETEQMQRVLNRQAQQQYDAWYNG